MSTLRVALEEYLEARRALGYKLRLAGSLLERFVDFADEQGATVITTKLAMQWATLPQHVQPAQWANRLGMVRGFARYRQAADPLTEVPAPQLLTGRFRRTTPHIYSEDELKRLIHAASNLSSVAGLRSCTYATLFGLFAVTGMRTNEPLRLDDENVDLENGVLTVHGAKFGKSRYVPLHDSTKRALRHYATQRDRLCTRRQCPSFFVSETGVRITEWSLRRTFVELSQQIGLRNWADSRGPRLMDFRHRFAVNTLIQWYRDDVDVQRHLPELSTYLGHTHITDTYWYLTAVPELMHLASQRLERAVQGDQS